MTEFEDETLERAAKIVDTHVAANLIDEKECRVEGRVHAANIAAICASQCRDIAAAIRDAKKF